MMQVEAVRTKHDRATEHGQGMLDTISDAVVPLGSLIDINGTWET